MPYRSRLSKSSRPTLALVVAALCAVCGAALVALAGAPTPAPARAAKAPTADIPSDVAPGHEHAGDLGVPGMSERELRTFETATLGPEHAREHALMRNAIREDQAEPESVAPEPKLSVAAADAEIDGTPADVGQWIASKSKWPIVAIHAALLPTGKVMFFSYPTYPNRPNNAEAYIWDPANPTAAPVQNNPPGKANIWCAGQTFTADGQLVVFGGNLDYESPSQTWKGLNKVFTFDPWANGGLGKWTEQPQMAHGRWYPTGVRLPDGRIPIVSGLDESGQLIPHSNTNQDVELFTPAATLGGLGTITKIGSIGTGDEAERAAKPIGNLYPRMNVLNDGHVYTTGPDLDMTWVIDDVDTLPTFAWHDIPNMTRHRVWGTTVPLPSGPAGPNKLMAIGGTQFSGEPSTTTTETYTIGGSWQQTGKDNFFGRGHANTVLLPDGSMVEVGGGRGSKPPGDPFPSELHYAEPEQRHIELWDPATGDWKLGPAQTEARAYHSTALLLPDGRVMSAGDDYNGDPGKVDAETDNDPMEDTVEIYEPPYLFRGPRPAITGAPATIGFNGSFSVSTNDTNITGAALASPAAVTHGVDMNQRMLKLPVVQGSGCVSVTAPTSPNAAPPGYYMLFLLNDQGVPSVAKFVRLQTGGTLGGCGTAEPPDLAPPTVNLVSPQNGQVAGTVEMRATASDDRGVKRVDFRVDGNVVGSDTSSPYTYNWHTTGVPDGPHTVTATAVDVKDKQSAPSTALVNVENTDTDGPSVSIGSPGDGATVTATTPITATASDPSGVDEVEFRVDGTRIGAPDPAAPYSVQWSSINVPNGQHELTAVARDELGNESTSASVTVDVQNEEGDPVNALPPKKTPQQPTQPGGGGSGGGGGGGGGSQSNLAPTLTRLKLSQSSFRKGKSTTISFRLSEAAKVKLSFERKLSGRRVRGRCVKPAKGARPNCTRYSKVRTTMTVQAKAGANSLVFRGRLSRTRVLDAGRYRLTLVATDSTGKRSAAGRLSFTLRERASTARAHAVRAIVLGWL